jgi:hypothetical protein
MRSDLGVNPICQPFFASFFGNLFCDPFADLCGHPADRLALCAVVQQHLPALATNHYPFAILKIKLMALPD